MHPFDYVREQSMSGAARAGARPSAKFIAGGTNLVDLMKANVERPAHVVDINALPLASIEDVAGGIRIGALARMADVAAHPLVQERFPAVSQALLASASPQLRNAASIGGNLLQRTRCPYFRELLWTPCNKRDPGSGCAAIGGDNRMQAVLGTSEHCIAQHMSDFAVAVAALDGVLTLHGPRGERAAFVVSERARPDLVRVRAGLGRGRAAHRRRRDPRRAHRLRRHRHEAVARQVRAGRARRAEAVREDLPRRGRGGAEGGERLRHERLQDRARQAHARARARGPRGRCGVIGEGRDRVDGRAKVTGHARFAAENNLPGLVHAVVVASSIPSGTIKSIDTAAAKKAPGVIAVLSHLNAPKLNPAPAQSAGGGGGQPSGNFAEPHHIPFSDASVHYVGQQIAVVVADTLEHATHGAELVKIAYDVAPARTDMNALRNEATEKGSQQAPPFTKGDPLGAFATAPVKIDQVYRTPHEHHNPIEAHSIVAVWDGDRVTLHDSSQNIFAVRQTLARAFGIPRENVEVMSPFVGGAFGSKGSTWPHVLLGALAARVVKRPVKLG